MQTGNTTVVLVETHDPEQHRRLPSMGRAHHALQEPYLVIRPTTFEPSLWTGARWRLVVSAGNEAFEAERTQQSIPIRLLSGPELNSRASKREDKCCVECCNCSCDPCKVRHVLESPKLRRVRDWGREVVFGRLFPLFSKFGRELVSLLELFTAIAMVAFSLPTFVINKCTEGYIPYTDFVRLLISVVSTVLAAIGAFLVLRKSKCALLKALNKCRCKRNRYRPMVEPDVPSTYNSETDIHQQGKWSKFDRYFNDIIRLLVAEALIYPTVICNVIDNASRRTYQGNATEKFTFVRFIFSAVWLIIHVYLLRIIVIGGTIIYLEMARRAKVVETEYYGNGREDTQTPIRVERLWEDPHTKRRTFRGIVLQIFFLLHVFGQMLTQGLMIGAIWSKIECENPESIPGNGPVYLSPYTWIMVVLGFLLPIVGTCTFIIPTYVWTEEFPVDFMMGMLSALSKKYGVANIKQGMHERANKIYSLLMNIENLANANTRCFCKKLFFPFYSPRLVVFSCIYDVVLLSFAIFFFTGQIGIGDKYTFIVCPSIVNVTIYDYSALNITDLHFDIVYLNDGLMIKGWLLYYLVGVALTNVANIIVVIIGLFWMVLMPVLIPFILAICLAAGILYLVLSVICGS